MPVPAKDKRVLRELARRVAEIAALPIQKDRAKLWRDHNALRPTRPVVLAQPEGAWTELVPDSSLQCSGELLRSWEHQLRCSLFRGLHIPDDQPLTGNVYVPWVSRVSNYGMEAEFTRGENRGSYRWDAPIKTEKDFDKLRFRELTVDRAATRANLDLAKELLGDLVPVVQYNSFWWTVGLTWSLVTLRGLEQVMMDLYDNPRFVHRMMAFLRDDTMQFAEKVEAEGLLGLNNGPDSYVGSGGIGHSDELPAPGFDSGRVRLKDLWGLGESQEFVGVGPAQFEEFALEYQLPILAKFGLVCYGCCEPLDQKFDPVIGRVPNLRRISISPWCNRQIAADKLGDRFVYSWKPNPAMICAPTVDWAFVEKTTRETVRIARSCRLEMVMKDTHTVHNEPARFTRWCEMAVRLSQES